MRFDVSVFRSHSRSGHYAIDKSVTSIGTHFIRILNFWIEKSFESQATASESKREANYPKQDKTATDSIVNFAYNKIDLIRIYYFAVRVPLCCHLPFPILYHRHTFIRSTTQSKMGSRCCPLICNSFSVYGSWSMLQHSRACVLNATRLRIE